MVQFDRDRLAELCREFDVERLRVFGSAARGEERPGSDVDLIADFRQSKGYVELVELEDRLSELFGRPVDLLTENGISPYLRDAILATTSVLFDER
ncbi:MAG: nucleotidyltransferase family protein [Candidatus Palauibacterales bacterium]|nr:nucleotidyltransferase family protein [Candidatus Palauibacterales bacterium]MDP2528361.1 nucleotidyltransferase family protein [Candidatus Palauibacterales bacterium]MDP2584400.1 nucleotidyltransferase family protein [Candidatus Palauibacterales bacterium]